MNSELEDVIGVFKNLPSKRRQKNIYINLKKIGFFRHYYYPVKFAW